MDTPSFCATPTLLRCLFSRPELLGEPSPAAILSPTAARTTIPASPKNDLENGAKEVDAGNPSESVAMAGGGGGSVSVVPVSMVVRAVKTLSSPPFLRRGGVPDAGKRRGAGGSDIPPRLQLAAISVLRALVSGQGAEFVVKTTAAASAGREVGPEEEKEEEEEKEKEEVEELAKDEGERFTYIDYSTGRG